MKFWSNFSDDYIMESYVFSKDVYRRDVPDHARFSPSGCKEWLDCPGYAYLESEAGEAALKGREEHSKEEKIIEDRMLKKEYEGPTTYSNYILSKIKGSKFLLLEQKLCSEDFKDVFFGSPDAVLSKERGHVEIVDLKTGKYHVNPKFNLQLACYLLLMESCFKLEPIKKATFTIAQHDEVTSWDVDMKWFTNVKHEILSVINDYAEKKELKTEFFKPSPACSSCFKRNKCPVYSKTLNKEVTKLDLKVPLADLPEKDFVALWEMGQKIKKHLKSIDNELTKREKEGKINMLEKETAREVSIWKNKAEALKNSKFVEKALISVSQAKKIMTPDELDQFVSKRRDTRWVKKESN